MDDFDLETLDKYIKKYKRNIIFKLENVNLTEKEMRNQSDNLCMVLEYSPRVLEERKIMGKLYFFIATEKFKIKTNQIMVPENIDKTLHSRSLILENKPTQQDDSSDESNKESNIKLSRFSSKLKMDLPNEIQIHNIMKTLVMDIINKTLEGIKPPEDDDSEDEYFKMMEQRFKRMEEGNKKIGTVVSQSVSNSKVANKFNESTRIRVYMLNTQNYIDFLVGINESVKDLKTKILARLENEGKVKLKYHIVEAYEIRMIEDDDDDMLPNMELPALEDKLNIIKSKNEYLAFVEKINFNPETDMSLIGGSILGTTMKDSETVRYKILVSNLITVKTNGEIFQYVIFNLLTVF